MAMVEVEFDELSEEEVEYEEENDASAPSPKLSGATNGDASAENSESAGGANGVVEKKENVDEKFPQENFRVLSEMPILAKIKVVIFDFGGVSLFFSEIWREIRF